MLSVAFALALSVGGQTEARTPNSPRGCVNLPASECLPLQRGDDDSPIVAATLNGSEPYFFMLDTGASSSTIDDATALKLALPRVKATEQAQGWGGGFEVHFYKLSRFQAGPLSLRNTTPAGVPAPDFDSHQVVGLAGADLFGARLIVWDIPMARIRLGHSGSPPPGTGEWRVLTSNWIRPWKVMVPVEINGVQGWGLIDTGAQSSSINPAFAAALGLTEASGRLRPGGEVSGIDGKSIKVREADVGAVRIGEWQWETMTLTVADLPFFNRLGKPGDLIMVIGVDWLKSHPFAMDYGKKVVWQRAR